MKVAVAGFLYNADKDSVYLIQRGPTARTDIGKWQLPGGAVDQGESLEEALGRELKEEIKAFLEFTYFPTELTIIQERYPDEDWLVFVYLIESWSGDLEIGEDGKISDIKCVPVKEALTSYNLSEGTRKILSNFSEGKEDSSQRILKSFDVDTVECY